MKLEKINIWAIILGLVIILQLLPAYWKKIPGLSRTLSVSKDFPGLDFFNKFKDFPGFSRTVHGDPGKSYSEMKRF
jgi:hypothetical protein